MSWPLRVGRAEEAWFLFSGDHRGEVSHSDQVVGRRGELEHPADQIRPSMSGLAHQPDCLHPAEDLFDALAFLLAHGVTGMTRDSAVNGTGAFGRVLRDVRGDIHAPAFMNEVYRVVVLVAAEGSRPADLAGHHNGSFAFRRSCGLGHAGVDDQPVAVLDLVPCKPAWPHAPPTCGKGEPVR